MLKSKGLWYLMMGGALAGWAFIVAGLVKPFEDEKLKKFWKQILLVWVLGHPLEMLLSMRIGRAAGVSPVKTAVKTMLFGFTWWLPLKLKVFK
ncbi:MAG TPA: hypothetical protein PLA83_10105 [Deltaproteobacteria bacterium]|nr:hypothetical protein [Deltaproteobacteria bacterium]HQI02285.1 hypothetical protein [Deltaproteobacteria bacterium]HQJ07990.1 hypothetical protein [Deltaproteobacteria bacterium]